MPAFTLGRLAKLYGMHRSSVYEAVAKGRVSAGFDRSGQRVIDLAEAIRVWGEPPAIPTPDTAPDTTPKRRARQSSRPDPTDLARIIADAVAEAVEPLRKEIEQLREALLLIEHRPETAKNVAESVVAEKKVEPPTNAELKPAKSFADLLDALNDKG